MVASAPAVLDTLNELAQALGEDPNFATTVAGQIGDIQSELDVTQVGAGLETDGNYNPDLASNYISMASSLKDADSLLDAEIKTVSDALTQENADRIAHVDGEVGRATLAEWAIQYELDVTVS